MDLLLRISILLLQTDGDAIIARQLAAHEESPGPTRLYGVLDRLQHLCLEWTQGTEREVIVPAEHGTSHSFFANANVIVPWLFLLPTPTLPESLSHGLQSPCAWCCTLSACNRSVDECLTSALSSAWTTIVGLLYHSMHYYLNNIPPASTK